ncbi:MAG: hypothetical protein NTZ97_00325 [Candidatus Moranbacteria bacterium]|nr:hypothetical protein [Candidatus Moranbacteria bacterium]
MRKMRDLTDDEQQAIVAKRSLANTGWEHLEPAEAQRVLAILCADIEDPGGYIPWMAKKSLQELNDKISKKNSENFFTLLKKLFRSKTR